MSKKQVVVKSNQDGLKWGGIFLLWVLSFAAYYFFSTVPGAIKAIGWIIVICVSLLTLMTTAKGKSIFSFMKDAHVELRKVVWPMRKEAGQITLIVILVVFLAGIFLWGVDSAVIWCIGKITSFKT